MTDPIEESAGQPPEAPAVPQPVEAGTPPRDATAIKAEYAQVWRENMDSTGKSDAERTMGSRRLLALSGELLALERQAQAPPAPAAMVPTSPAAYRIDASIVASTNWPEGTVEALQGIAHQHQLTQAQAGGMAKWTSFVTSQIQRDGTGAMTEQFWTAFGHQAAALGLTEDQAFGLSEVLHRWGEAVDASQARQQAARRKIQASLSGMPPGHARR
jgi:hypothetical protein